MDSTPVSDRLCQLVSDLTARPLSFEAEGEVPLRDLGLSSLRMIQLIADLESTFRMRVEDEDVGEENFGTLSGLVRFVEGRTKT